MITAAITASAAAGDGMSLAFGIGITTGDAFAAGAIPDPYQEADWDGWLYHSFLPMITPSTAFAFMPVEIDSKAMRKFQASDVIFGCVEASEFNDGATVIVCAETRILLKLS